MGRKFTEEEIKMMRKLCKQGKSYKEIAVELNSDQRVIRTRLVNDGFKAKAQTSNKEYYYKVGQEVNGLRIIEKTRVKNGKNRTGRGYVVASLTYPDAPYYEISESDLKKGNGDAYVAGKRSPDGTINNYTDTEIELLKSMVKQGHTNNSIAYELGKSKRSVEAKIHKLKLKRPTTQNVNAVYSSNQLSGKRLIWASRNGKIEDIKILRLIRRDGNKCYLCNEEVSFKVDVFHPLYPNVEHVVPLSNGGTHTYKNTRVACRGCNMSKGSKSVDEFKSNTTATRKPATVVRDAIVTVEPKNRVRKVSDEKQEEKKPKIDLSHSEMLAYILTHGKKKKEKVKVENVYDERGRIVSSTVCAAN